MLQLDHTQNQYFLWYIRYRYKQKEKNVLPDAGITHNIIPYEQQRIRI